jgi:hypothetical protein
VPASPALGRQVQTQRVHQRVRAFPPSTGSRSTSTVRAPARAEASAAATPALPPPITATSQLEADSALDAARRAGPRAAPREHRELESANTPA